VLTIQAAVGLATSFADGERKKVIPATSLMPILLAYVVVIPNLPAGNAGAALCGAGSFAVLALLAEGQLLLACGAD
jgi:hypothetical protein